MPRFESGYRESALAVEGVSARPQKLPLMCCSEAVLDLGLNMKQQPLCEVVWRELRLVVLRLAS